jgi:ribosomal-protein-alanine N-acetyltransferase
MEILLKSGKLRTWKTEDAVSLAHHANNKKIADMMRNGFPFPYTINDAGQWLDKVIKDEKNILLAIEIDNEAAGGIGILPFGNVYRKGAEIGYWLGEEHWNKGIATDAVSRIVNHAFSYTELIRISACVFEKNRASMRVLEKAGFYLEGIHKKAVIKNDVLMDEYQYVILKSTN